MKTADLVAVFGSMQGVGDQFDISRSAVCQWGEEVPELREFQIREKYPDIDRRISAARRRVARLEAKAA